MIKHGLHLGLHGEPSLGATECTEELNGLFPASKYEACMTDLAVLLVNRLSELLRAKPKKLGDLV